MPSTQVTQSSSPPLLPLHIPAKSICSPLPSQVSFSGILISPSQQPDSSANTSATPSLTSRSTAVDCESSACGRSRIELAEMLRNRLSSDMDPLQLDRSLVRQAQTSGELNAKHRELLELQNLAQRRFKATREAFSDGMRAADEVKRDLNWTQNRISKLKIKAERRYPTEYRATEDKYRAVVD